MKLIAADLSNIEGRALAFLAHEGWKLEAFRAYDRGDGADLYNITATSIIGGDPFKVAKKDRNVFGKVPDLALGYAGGVGALQTFAKAYQVEMAEHWPTIEENIAAIHVEKAKENYETWGAPRAQDMEVSELEWVASETVKLAWRARHPATVKLWAQVEEAARQAIKHKGKIFKAGRRLLLSIRSHAGHPYLLVKLPSGRYLTYFHPRLRQDDRSATVTYMGSYRRTPPSPPIWGEVTSYGGKFVENCVAKGTEVLTCRGWVAIEEIQADDKIHDGICFVSHGGLLYRSEQSCIAIDDVYMTPDHEVLTDDGWQTASQYPRPYRPEIRGISRDGEVTHRWAEVALGIPLRLWERVYKGWCRRDEGCATRRTPQLRMPDQAIAVEAENTRHVEAPSIRSLAVYVRQVQATYASSVGELWREGNNCLRALARVFREFLVGHGVFLCAGADFGPRGQQRGLLKRELSVGLDDRASTQPTWQHEYTNSMGHDDCERGGAASGHRPYDHTISHSERVARRGTAQETELRESKVYDILNCGPRSRFVVRGGSGPFIVHNCCQAFSRDIMAYNMPAAEAAGYAITLTVHDEEVTESKDGTHEELSAIMATVPPWAEGLPLAAAGFTATRYKKD